MPADSPSGPRLEGRGLEAAALVLLALVAFALRAAPITEMSLWWDELVHLQTASNDGFVEVFWSAKLGIPPGFGNAGAVPLDYLLLHAWLRVVPEPSHEWLEAYYRGPALLWSVLTVLLTYFYGRRFLDRGVAWTAAILLALSVSHSLYAAEVRFYSLFALMTVVNLYAFSALVLRRDRARSWILYTIVAVLYFATGFMGLLVMLLQYAILAVLVALDRPRESRTGPGGVLRRYAPLGIPLASGLVVLGAVALYLHGTFLGARYGRDTEGLDTWERTGIAFQFFSGQSLLLLGAFALGIVLLLVQGNRRGRDHLAIAVQVTGSFLVIPVIVEIERWKEYYFHPRHAFFLLPLFAIVAAAGLVLAMRLADPLRSSGLRDATRERVYVGAVLLLLIAIVVGPMTAHLEAPERRFARTKTLRDFKALVEHVRTRVDAMEPDQVYLLISERGRPGHIGNPMLAKYLQWHGLDERVVFRGTDRPGQTRRAMARECPDGCVGQPAARVQRKLEGIGPFNNKRSMLDLVEIAPTPQTRAPIGGIGLVHYWRFTGGPPRRAPGFEITTPSGLSLFERSLEPTVGGEPSGSLETRSS